MYSMYLKSDMSVCSMYSMYLKSDMSVCTDESKSSRSIREVMFAAVFLNSCLEIKKIIDNGLGIHLNMACFFLCLYPMNG